MPHLLSVLHESFLSKSGKRDRQQASFRAPHSSAAADTAHRLQEPERFGLAARIPRERRKLLPTDNYLQVIEKADNVPKSPGGKYHTFPQTEQSQFGQAHSMDRNKEAEDLLTVNSWTWCHPKSLFQPKCFYDFMILLHDSNDKEWLQCRKLW